MRHFKLAMTVMAAAVIAGCGGNDPRPGDQAPKLKYSSQITFGDSLSDVGTYKVGTVQAIGGGTFTINGDSTKTNPALTGKNWTELMAAQVGLPAPCPAVTGLDGDAASGFSVPVQAKAGCFGYAQGGARVTNPVGPGNKLAGSPLGALTVPLVTQVKNHLAIVGGKFKGDEIVYVMGGNNDVLISLEQLSTGATAAGTAAAKTAFATSLATQLAAGATNPATAVQSIALAIATEAARAGSTSTSIVIAAAKAAELAGNAAAASPAVYGPMGVKAEADATAAGTKAGADYAAAQAPVLVQNIAKAGAELVALVKTQVVANGANFVVVNNMPDIANTPSGLSQSASTRALIDGMVKAFNDTLAAGLSGDAKILLVDTYSASHDQATNPAPYGLTNVTESACDLTPAKNILGNSLGCSASNLKAGDVSHYAYADTVHPTPFLHLLLARYVSEKMVAKGWL
ncbi:MULTISPECIES: SGNH/GDSL hydrolase family protein [unclassified Duganella]|uniref:SGNH/GDSL hydrolase family protein n=1 Tax=unclassified Duganella TaxID=2636909 RepID=UPI0006F3679B|nr:MULTISPECIES: SGNH/GDSL hydrolase family protein [unclassified Duganella]KQV47559.1 esterase [Duganella sp. Root336D2]KRC00028.1 esterase [Duganella sp. Root198D2]